MTDRENVISLYRRKGFERVPVEFDLCPSLVDEFEKRYGSKDYQDHFGIACRKIDDVRLNDTSTDKYLKYYSPALKPGSHVDWYGVAHEPGSEEAMHMTYMRCPLRGIDSLDEVKEYPFPDFYSAETSHQAGQVEALHARGFAAVGPAEATIWENAWYLRGMEDLMVDMLSDDPIAEFILDKTLELNTFRAVQFAQAGCDIIRFGDDIGMQSRIMMSEDMYTTWIKPRLKKLIASVKAVNPDIVILYHSCGYVEPFIPHLIEAGIEVLNPVQPECMDFAKIHSEFGDVLSFNGTIGTQSTMPFGTPEDVRREVYNNLEIAGSKGGLLVCPTHLLEPEVPWENIEAYVQACRDFS